MLWCKIKALFLLVKTWIGILFFGFIRVTAKLLHQEEAQHAEHTAVLPTVTTTKTDEGTVLHLLIYCQEGTYLQEQLAGYMSSHPKKKGIRLLWTKIRDAFLQIPSLHSYAFVLVPSWGKKDPLLQTYWALHACITHTGVARTGSTQQLHLPVCSRKEHKSWWLLCPIWKQAAPGWLDSKLSLQCTSRTRLQWIWLQ